MSITLSPELEFAVKSKVSNGAFATPEEVIRAGLNLIDQREQQMAELRREIAIADEQVQQWKVGPFDPHATLERVRRDKQSRGSQ